MKIKGFITKLKIYLTSYFPKIESFFPDRCKSNKLKQTRTKLEQNSNKHDV